MTAYVVNRDGIANASLNGPMSCLDCHYTSIRHFSVVRAESTWVDSNGNELVGPGPGAILHTVSHRTFRPLPYPSRQGDNDTTHADSLARAIDTLVLRESSLGRVVQWMTDMAHMDGSRLVAFAPNNITDSTRMSTAYRASELSCSAVACHNRPAQRYRFASPARGISGCPSLLGHDSTCGETP